MKRLVLGPRAVAEAVAAHPRDVALVLIARGEPSGALRELLERARKQGIPIEERPRTALDALARGVRHQGVAAITGEYPYVDLDALLERLPERGALVAALDEVTDPRNLGAIVRSAVAFGARGIVVTRDRCAPVTTVAVRASAGATEHATIARVTNLARALDALREAGLRIVGLDAGGATPVHEIGANERGDVLVVGSEGRGLRRLTRERCDILARVPMAGPLGSLNASAAATVALYEVARHRDERPSPSEEHDELSDLPSEPRRRR